MYTKMVQNTKYLGIQLLLLWRLKEEKIEEIAEKKNAIRRRLAAAEVIP